MEEVLKKLQDLVALASEHPYATATTAAAALILLRLRFRQPSVYEKRPPGPANTVVLYGTGRGVRAPSLSPYCLKLETYLKLAKIPYIVSDLTIMSSKGKIPWISYNGEEVSDSQLCIEYLNRKFDVDLNKNLTVEQRAVAHAFRVLLDEYHFWGNAVFRFYNMNDDSLRRDLPSWLVRRYLKRIYGQYAHAQGMGRFTREEVLAIFTNNLQKMQDYLGDNTFFMGDEPTDVDCSLFGLVGQLIYNPPSNLGPDFLKEKFPKLHALCLRIKERAYPDWEQCLKK